MPFSHRSALVVALVAAVPALTPVAAHAQVGVTTDVATANAYVWRGVTFTNRPVFQPDAMVTAAAGRGSAIVGAAFNVEPVPYNHPGDLSVLGAESGTLVTATTLWAEYTRPVAALSITGGVTGYVFPHANGVAAAYNTAEVYGKVAAAGPLAPTLSVYYDVLQVRGAYLEGALHHTVAAGSHVAVTLGALAGFSAGQGQNPTRHESAYFVNDGLTHVDLSAAATWTAGAISVTPSVHGLLLRDAATQIIGPDQVSTHRLLLGVSLGWAHALTHAHAQSVQVAAVAATDSTHAESNGHH